MTHMSSNRGIRSIMAAEACFLFDCEGDILKHYMYVF